MIVCFSQYQTMSISASVKPSLFQAGSGKSYLMAGNDQELGVAPMVSPPKGNLYVQSFSFHFQ